MGLRRTRQGAQESGRAAQTYGGTGSPDLAVELRGVRRQYGRGGSAVHALRGIDLALARGSFTAVMGPSGPGKSTFLQCAAGLDRPTEGSVSLGGTEITGMSENKLTELRRTRLGFVFQAFNLLPSLTAEQNVVLPMRLAGLRTGSARSRRDAAEMLTRVGLGMTVLDRRRELTMLRLVGSTRRQVMGMIRWEALLVTVAGAALGTAIALATLIPMMKGLTGEAPYIPPVLYGSFVAATVGLGLAAALVPARAALSRTAARP